MPCDVFKKAKKFDTGTSVSKARKLEHEASKVFASARAAGRKGRL